MNPHITYTIRRFAGYVVCAVNGAGYGRVVYSPANKGSRKACRKWIKDMAAKEQQCPRIDRERGK